MTLAEYINENPEIAVAAFVANGFREARVDGNLGGVALIKVRKNTKQACTVTVYESGKIEFPKGQGANSIYAAIETIQKIRNEGQ